MDNVTTSPGTAPVPAPVTEPIKEPVTAPVPSSEKTSPVLEKRRTRLPGIGGGLGLLLGILLTLAVTQTYRLITDTIPSTATAVQNFDALNELRQQVNQMNEERKQKEQAQAQEQVAAVRQAVSAVTATLRTPKGETVRAPDSGTLRSPDSGAARPSESEKLSANPSLQKQGGSPAMPAPPVAKAHDPFADVDDAIKQLENTQKVLNTVLDLFSRNKDKERTKDR